MLKVAIGQMLVNNFCQSVQNPAKKEKNKKKNKGNCKGLCAQAQTQKKPPKKKVKLNESPEINLNWKDDESSYYWKVSEILKPRKYGEVRPYLTQQRLAFFLNIFLFFFVKWKVTSFFSPNCELVWHLIIVNTPICNCTEESAK